MSVSRRVAVTILLALCATLVIFLITSFLPGDPVLAQLGDMAAADPQIVAEYRARWGLDLPLTQQYLTFLSHLLHGDLGISINTSRPVMEDIAQYAPATIELSTLAFFLSLIIGIPLGIAAAVARDRWIDHLARIISLLGVSSPSFWLAFIVLTVFYGALKLAPGPGRLNPLDQPPPTVTGSFVLDSLLARDWSTLHTALAHLALPSAVLCATTLGLIARTTRASMLDTLGQEYVRVARSKGLSERAIILRHALPNALVPVVTLSGLAFANLLTGTIMTETVFSWPGLGRYTFQSAVSLDIPAIMAMTLVFAIVYLVINLLVDISYAFLDPRVQR